MSGKSIASKIARAFGKVGKKVGYKFKIYRSLDYIQPIDDRNYMGELFVGFTPDKGFEAQRNASLQPLILYVDNSVNEGDILVSDDQGVITVVSKFDLRASTGIETNELISISRTSYGTTGGFGPKSEVVYTQVPAKVLQVASVFTGDVQAVASQLGGATPVFDVWTYLPAGHALYADDTVIFASGKKAIIKSIEHNPLGYKLKVMEVA